MPYLTGDRAQEVEYGSKGVFEGTKKVSGI